MDAWLEPCRESLQGLGQRIAPICPAAEVSEHKGRNSVTFEASSPTARCGLGVRLDSYSSQSMGRPVWRKKEWCSWFQGRGWDSLERTRHGLSLEVAARGTAKVRRALLGIGKAMAEACTPAADDGYREYRLTVDQKDQTGKCIEDSKKTKVGWKALAIHTQSGVLDYQYRNTSRLLLHADGKQWVAEEEEGLIGPLFGCGPTSDCVKILGSRTIRWRLAWSEESLAAELTTLDFSAEDDERPVCQVHVKLHGELVPQ